MALFSVLLREENMFICYLWFNSSLCDLLKRGGSSDGLLALLKQKPSGKSIQSDFCSEMWSISNMLMIRDEWVLLFGWLCAFQGGGWQCCGGDGGAKPWMDKTFSVVRPFFQDTSCSLQPLIRWAALLLLLHPFLKCLWCIWEPMFPSLALCQW